MVMGAAAGRGTPVLHALHVMGRASETFIRDAIAETGALGWTPWLIAESSEGQTGGVPAQRVLLTPGQLPPLDKLLVRLELMRGRPEAPARAARAYRAALAKAPPGLLHAHFGWTGIACTLAARTLALPLIVSLHGTDATVQMREPQWAPAYRELFAQAACVTVVSRFLERRLREFGYAGAIELIASGVRVERFPLTGPPHPGAAPRLLFVGRLIECKGLDTLIDALALLRSRGLEATLRVVGDGPRRAAAEAQARALLPPAAIAFLGTLRHDQVRSELGRADIVVVPSRDLPSGQAEGSPVVSKEAQASGVPVVATNVGGIPETLPPQLRHELVPQDRPDLLAARIAEVWAQRERWPERVRLQRDWIVSEFSWEKIARRLSDLYERVLDEHPPRHRRLQRALHRAR
jgi:colanic acid/amylovoran biosynthesis glycosyltransferase